MKFITSTVEAAYVVYMLNYFKTTISYSKYELPPCFDQEWFKHPTGESHVPMSKICGFGNNVAWIFAAYLLGRNAFKENRTVNNIVLATGFFMSLLNANVFVYLSPVFLFELLS